MDRLSFELPGTEFLGTRTQPGISTREHGEGVAVGTALSLWRQRYLILFCVLLGLVAAAMALALMERRYVSEAVVQIDPSRRDSAMVAVNSNIPGVSLDAASLVQSEARIIQSRTVARSVAENLRIIDEPRYDPRTQNAWSPSAVVNRVVNWIRMGLGRPIAKLPLLDPAVQRENAAVQDLLEHLRVGTDNRSYLITIGYTATDPVQAARTANAFAQTYLARSVQNNVENATRTSTWLVAQIREARAALNAAERSIAEYREHTGLLQPNSEAENVRQQQLRALNTQRAAAGLTRLNEELRLARIKEAIANGRAPFGADVPELPVIGVLAEREAQLRREMEAARARPGAGVDPVTVSTLAHVRARLDEESKRAVPLVTAAVTVAQQSEDALRRQLDALQQTMVVGKASETELQNMLMNADAIRQRLVVLVRNNEQAVAASTLNTTPATLITPAEPERVAASPKPVVVIGLAVAGGLLLGICLCLLLERRDRGYRTSHDIQPKLDLRCLGMVPEMSPARRAVAAAPERAMYDEAIYAVAAGVSLFDNRGGGRIVLVTSALPGEGKTTLCMSLAETLVGIGNRTLVIDSAVMRAGAPKSSMSETFREHGDILLPHEKREPLVVIRRSDFFLLGTDPGGPNRISKVLEEMRRHFDVILVEGAPTMLVADSLVLGRLADTVIQVTRWGHTRKRTVEAAVRRLREHSVVVDGIVLMSVNLRRHAALGVQDEFSFFKKQRRFFERLGQRGRQHAEDRSRAA